MTSVGDYHVHTHWSDGAGAAAAAIAVAASRGVPEIGFADHVVPPAIDDGYGLPLERLAEYVQEVRRAAAAVAAPKVLLAVEADYVPGSWPRTAALLGGHALDYVIGSVHALDGESIDLDASSAGVRWPDADELFAAYYEVVAEMAATAAIDVVGHLDLPKKYGRRASPAVRPREDAALDAIAAAGIVVEVNTAGLRNPAAEPYPSLDLLRRLRKRGVAITFGSDAHRPEQVGAGLSEGCALARAAGYRSWMRLSSREEVPLP